MSSPCWILIFHCHIYSQAIYNINSLFTNNHYLNATCTITLQMCLYWLVGSCSYEVSFSTIGRFNTRIRTTMSYDKLNRLILLYVHRNNTEVSQLDTLRVLRRQDLTTHRRINLAFRKRWILSSLSHGYRQCHVNNVEGLVQAFCGGALLWKTKIEASGIDYNALDDVTNTVL